MVMSSISRTLHLRSHIQPREDVRLRDVTSSCGVLAIMDPKSRSLLASVSDVDLSNAAVVSHFEFQKLATDS
ncbi:MAG: hypothetical protein ACR2RF_20450 [Geminicoccaceae bacterium]